MSIYLPWLLRDVQNSGVTFEYKRIDSLRGLCGKDSVVVNRSGYGAHALVPDPSVFATWGQVVYVTKPAGLDSYLSDDDHPLGMTYILPRTADIVLGGCAIEGKEGESPDSQLTTEIVQRCQMIDPRLVGFEIIGSAAGVRPCRRGGVRVEWDADTNLGLLHNTVMVVRASRCHTGVQGRLRS
jgi:D-amino-acid oxidase